MRYFVTGATGFIGGHVARQLVAAGHDVVALVRTPDRARELAALGVKLHQGDITAKDSLREPMAGVDGVFHLAGWYEIGVRDVAGMARVNVDGTRNVLETMRELGIPKGVYTSTVGVFSSTDGVLVDETYRYHGAFNNAYEQTKWTAYYTVVEPLVDEGLPLVTVMPSLVYGPGDHSLIRQLLRWWARGWLKVVPAQAAYCWAHVEDTAAAHIRAMERGTPGETYIIAGQPASFDDVLRLGADLFGIPAPRVRVAPAVFRWLAAVLSAVEHVLPLHGMISAETMRTVGGVTYLGSNAKARRELDLVLRELAVGLRETAEHEMALMGIEPPRRPD